MLDFPKVDRSSSGFKNNFLNKFVLNLIFLEKFDFEKIKSEATLLFDNYKRVSIQPRNLLNFKINRHNNNIISSTIDEDFIELKTVSGKRKILITENSIAFEIDGDDYNGFEDFLENEIKQLSKILNNNNIQNISLTQLRKINVLGYEGVAEVQPLVVAEGIFSEELTKSFEYIPNDNKNFKRKLDTIQYNYDDLGMNLVLKYGLIVDSDESGKIVLDIDVSKKNHQNNKLVEDLQELNNRLFNVFYWAINEKAKRLLRQ